MSSDELFFPQDIKVYLSDNLKHLNYRVETIAYIIDVLSSPNINLSDESITLSYFNALDNSKFKNFQQIGDWLLFAQSIFPKFLKNAPSSYYNAIAQLSYYKCYKILRGQWLLYEELADNFPNITNKLNETISPF
jgi:hypothetical protein